MSGLVDLGKVWGWKGKKKISKKENIFLKADVAIFWHLSTDVATLATKIETHQHFI